MKKREVCDTCEGGVEEARTLEGLTTCSACEINQEVAEEAPVVDESDGED